VRASGRRAAQSGGVGRLHGGQKLVCVTDEEEGADVRAYTIFRYHIVYLSTR
jgi:hypothetical protein